MIKKKLKKHNWKKPGMGAKLTFHEWFRESPIYSIKATTTEKEKGIDMIELIESNFNINSKDKEEAFKKRLDELNEQAFTPTEVPEEMKDGQIKWTRDDTGKIISPFRSKRKIFDKKLDS